jgi:hypothetical protein
MWSLRDLVALPPSRGCERSLDAKWVACVTPLPLRCLGVETNGRADMLVSVCKPLYFVCIYIYFSCLVLRS